MTVVKLEGDLENTARIFLGDERVTAICADLIRRLSAGKDTYMIEWEERSRVPRGAIVSGQEIGWIQHGMVYSVDGKVIGHYGRIVDDLSQPKQSMLVFLDRGNDDQSKH